MPNRAEPGIRKAFREDSELEVRFTSAIAADTFYLREDVNHRVLFVHPVHEQLVQSLQRPT